MEHEITNTIAKLVRSTGTDFERQIQYQSQRLRPISCVNPTYGRWVEVGIEFLFSALELEDADFAARLPALADLNKSDRRRFLNGMKDHLHACCHCALKYEYERDFNERIEQTFEEHRDTLLRALQRDGEPTNEN